MSKLPGNAKSLGMDLIEVINAFGRLEGKSPETFRCIVWAMSNTMVNVFVQSFDGIESEEDAIRAIIETFQDILEEQFYGQTKH